MNDELFALEDVTSQMALWLMEEQNMSMQQALSAIFNSRTYELLQDASTGLLSQSDAYIYDTLLRELS